MRRLIILAVVFTPLALFAQNLKKDKSLERILSLPDKEAIKSRIKYLADDRLQGRRASAPGYKVAVDYVIDQFKELGIAAKGDEGYIQKVRIRTGKTDSTKVSVAMNGIDLIYGSEFVVMPDLNNPSTNFKGDVIFVGQGIFAPHLSHNDYEGVDVKGKVVMMYAGVPETFPHAERAHFTSTAMRAEVAASKGAIGAIVINKTARQYATARSSAKNGIQGIINKGGWAISRSGVSHPAMSFYGFGNDSIFNLTLADKKPGDFAGIIELKSATTYTEFETYNVVGIIPGSDKRLKDEYVVHSAHLDHLGIRASVKGDSIYNGAHDNASGVAAVLEIAKLYKVAKPKRSILIAIVTGEEMGLLGSAYFASNPPVEKNRIVANINSDMPTLIAPLLSIEPLGAWNSSLMNETTVAARYLNLEIQEDHIPDQVRFTRSDQYSFIREGIPALALKSGLKSNDPNVDLKKAIDDWTKTHYHRPSDQYSDTFFDWDAAITYVKLNFLVGYLVANNPQRPTWNKGDFFGDTFGANFK